MPRAFDREMTWITRSVTIAWCAERPRDVLLERLSAATRRWDRHGLSVWMGVYV